MSSFLEYVGQEEEKNKDKAPKTFVEAANDVMTPDEYEGTGAELKLIPLHKICVRYTNWYGSSDGDMKTIVEDIRENGQITPIKIYKIEDTIKNPLFSEDAQKYYKKMQDTHGCEFFVNEGHRRFKAFVSLALNKDIVYDDEVEACYSELKEEYEKYDVQHKALNCPVDNKYIVIKAEIEDNISKSENDADDNLQQRSEIKSFAVYYNMRRKMIQNGSLDEIIQQAKSSKIDGMTDRMVKENLKKLKNEGVISQEDQNKCVDLEGKEDINKLRNLFKSLDSTYVPGIDKYVAAGISNYIYKKTNRTVETEQITKMDRIIETFNPKIIKEIINGNISLYNAKKMLPKYGEIFTNKVDEIVKEARNHTFNVENYLNDSGEAPDPKTIQQTKPKKIKIKKYTKQEIINLLEGYLNNDMSLQDAINNLKNE